MFALLFHERGMTKEEWLDSDDWTDWNVYFRPDANADDSEAGFYWPVPRYDPRDPPKENITWRQLFFKPVRVEAMKAAGMTDEQMEAKYRDWIKSLQT